MHIQGDASPTHLVLICPRLSPLVAGDEEEERAPEVPEEDKEHKPEDKKPEDNKITSPAGAPEVPQEPEDKKPEDKKITSPAGAPEDWCYCYCFCC